MRSTALGVSLPDPKLIAMQKPLYLQGLQRYLRLIMEAIT